MAHDFQKLETTQMSLNEGMNKQVICAYSGILLSNKKQWTDTCKNMGSSQIHMLREECQSQKVVHCMMSGKGETVKTENISVVAWGLEERLTTKAHGGILGGDCQSILDRIKMQNGTIFRSCPNPSKHMMRFWKGKERLRNVENIEQLKFTLIAGGDTKWYRHYG